jgi:hypothetical protein
MQDGATAHTANYSANSLNEVFDGRLIKNIACKVSRLIPVIFICNET